MNISAIKSKKKIKKSADRKDRLRIASLDKKKARAGWLFVLPFILGFLLIYIPIIGKSIGYSFSKLNLVSGGGIMTENVMFENYEYAIKDTSFVNAVLTGLKNLLIEVPVIVFFSLFVAILLNQKMVGRSAFRAIFFIPVILATGLISYIDAMNNQSADVTNAISTGSSSTGIIDASDIEALFKNMAAGSGIVNIVTGFINKIYDIVNRSGVQMLIFLAGLQGISPSVYESCQMEGASAWEIFWKITLPMISPMILVNFVYTLIDSFTAQSNTVMTYISGIFESGGNTGMVRASAMSWLYFLVVIILVAIVVFIISKLVFYQRRD
ncbi:MAG: sugar ABC transporter permease [Clostridia bacterium]|nr:sugar ABC transporter permease [Clostridia bacterium]